MRLHCQSIVGRSEQLERLDDVVRSGRGGGHVPALVLVGEAGYGKSRLVRWLIEHPDDVVPLVGRIAPHRPARHAFSEVALAALRAGSDHDARDVQLYRAALRVLLPELFGDSTARDVGPLMIGHALVELAAAIPLAATKLVVVEDVHWVDAEGLLALDAMVDLAASRGVAVVLTARPREHDEVDRLVNRWHERRAAEVVPIEPLPTEELSDMVGACLGGEPPSGLVGEIVPIADGSPLLVEEILSAVVDAGRLTAVDGGWKYESSDRLDIPQTLSAAVHRQAASLAPGPVGVLALAAMVGRLIGFRELATLGVTHDRVEEAVAAGLACGLVVSNLGTNHDRPGFRHVLIQEALVRALPAEERRRIAREALSPLRAAGLQSREELRLAAALAPHAGDSELEVDANGALAEVALSDGQPEDALDPIRTAEQRENLPLAKRRHLQLLRLEAASQQGEVIAARQLSARLVPELAAHGDRGELVRCQLALARAEGAAGNWVEAAAALPGETEGELPVEVLSFSALTSIEIGDVDRARALAVQALGSTRIDGSPSAQCEALEVMGRVARLESYEAAAAMFSNAVHVAERNDLRLWRARALLELGLCEATQFKDGTTFELARTAAVEAGAVGLSAKVDYMLAQLYSAGFDDQRTDEVCRRGLMASRRMRLPAWEARLLIMRGHAHAGAGRPGEARACGQDAIAVSPDDVEIRALAAGACDGFAALIAEDRELAVESYRQCLDLFDELDYRTATIPWYDLALIGQLADPDEFGRRAYEGSLDPGVFGAVADWLPLAEAVAEGRQGNGDLATSLVEGVLTTARDQARDGVRWGRIDLWMRLVGEAALDDGWGDAPTWLADAESGLRANQVLTVADACRRLLRRTGARPTPRLVEAVPPELHELGVTKREVDVLLLLIDRRTNNQIADRLGISPRTVKSHIEHLLTKTGRKNRIELAQLALTVGLGTSSAGEN